MKRLLTTLLLIAVLVPAWARPSTNKPNQTKTPGTASAQQEDISGMYSFLREGEFVQVTVEDGDVVSGFISRYGDSGSDNKTFLDQFFSKAALKDKHLTFTTKSVHGVYFEFDGTVERGPGKTPRSEGYRVLRGTLREVSEDAAKKQSSKSRQVEFKSFPQDLDEEAPEKPN